MGMVFLGGKWKQKKSSAAQVPSSAQLIGTAPRPADYRVFGAAGSRILEHWSKMKQKSSIDYVDATKQKYVVDSVVQEYCFKFISLQHFQTQG